MTGTVAFTICSWNYLAYAITLRDSFAQHHHDTPFYIFIADSGEHAGEDQFIVPISKEIMPSFDYSSSAYSVMEFNTSIKPSCIKYLIEKLKFAAVVYLDPDILVVNSLAPLFERLLGPADAVLTPHMLRGYDDDKTPSEIQILQAGVYNLGFIGLNNSAAARGYLDWWAKRLADKCVVSKSEGYFVDQRFCDFVPAFIERTFVTHDPGYNIAYWNMHQRPVTRRGDDLYVGEHLVRFVHFSGIIQGDVSRLSKYTDRIDVDRLGDLRDLFYEYHRLLAQNDIYSGGSYSEIPYAFGRLKDGTKITPLMSRCIMKFGDPTGDFPASLADAVFEAETEDLPRDAAAPITRIVYEFYRDTPDLCSRFDLSTMKGRRDYIHWFRKDTWLAQHFPECGAFYRRQRPPSPLREAIGALFVRRLSQRASSQKPALSVYGFFKSQTGLAQAARGYADALQSVGGTVSRHAVFSEPGKRPTQERAASYHALLVMNADNIMRVGDFIEAQHLKGRTKIGYMAWELPVFPAAWAPAFAEIDEIWVGSSFVRDVIAAATTKPVRIVPHVVEANRIDRDAARTQLQLELDRPVYLTTFDFDSFPARKNPLASIAAFKDAFPQRGDGPKFIVKCHGSQNRAALADIRAAIGDRSDIVMFDGVWSRGKMRLLQAACDVFVSLHRSEGFGLNIAECMSAAKTVVVTAFSGNLDFTRAENSLLVPFAMAAVARDDYPYGAGQWWAEPNHDDAVEALRQAADTGLRQRLGGEARQFVERHLTNEPVGRRMIDALAST